MRRNASAPHAGDFSCHHNNLEDLFMPLEPQPADIGPLQRVRLPDSLIHAIRLVAADPSGAPMSAVHAAVLITYGYALYTRQQTIDPCAFAIPTDQWTTISQALLDVPALSEVGRVNLGLEWVNLGPSGVDDVPPLDNRTAGTTPAMPPRDGDEQFPVSVWQAQVAAGSTRLGYGPWVSAQRLLAQDGVLS
jgi:hypothetical protein